MKSRGISTSSSVYVTLVSPFVLFFFFFIENYCLAGADCFFNRPRSTSIMWCYFFYKPPLLLLLFCSSPYSLIDAIICILPGSSIWMSLNWRASWVAFWNLMRAAWAVWSYCLEGCCCCFFSLLVAWLEWAPDEPIVAFEGMIMFAEWCCGL